MAWNESQRKERHRKLYQDFVETLGTTGENYDAFINAALGVLPKGLVNKHAGDLYKLLDLMTSRGVIFIGRYEKLRDMVENIDSDLVRLIEEAENDFSAHAGEGVVSSTERFRAGSTSGNALGGRKPSITGQRDESDQLYIMVDGKSYYNNTDKKGFLLILNSVTNREGAQKDVENLKGFFKDVLQFDVENPREHVDRDFNQGELDSCLKSARNKLNTQSKQYYCFFCAILSHGNEVGIATSDNKLKPVEEIRKMFANDEVKGFIGKPKVFLVQACRGTVGQKYHEVKDEEDSYEPDQQILTKDQPDVTCYIPTDADILIAYATTPGYTAYRRTEGQQEQLGSWFITQAVETFKQNHKTDHLEEMMITVREKMAFDERWETIEKTRQMPCTWSTLTCRLKFA